MAEDTMFAFYHLVSGKENATLLAKLIESKISKNKFKESSIYNSLLECSNTLCEDNQEYTEYWENAKYFVQLLDFNDKSSLENFLNNSGWLSYWPEGKVEFARKATVKNVILLFFHHIIGNDFGLMEQDRHYKPQSVLVKLLADKVFIKQAEKDKKHIINLQKDLEEVQKYLAKKSPSIRKFIKVNIGWFDEPFMNGDYNDLKKLLKQSLKECDLWINEEKNGKNLRSVDPECFHISMSSGQDDSWEEWKYIFPNVYKYLFDE
jgi:hypothetical protein